MGNYHRKALATIAVCELELQSIHFYLCEIWKYFTSNRLTIWEKEALQDDYLRLALRYEVISQTRIMLRFNLKRLGVRTTRIHATDQARA